MKKVYFLTCIFLIIGLLFPVVINAQTLLAEQNFEELATDTWTPTASPTPYVVGTDVWNKIPALNEIAPQSNSNFWGMWDLENPNGGGTATHILDFPNISVNGEVSLQASFHYYTVGFDSGDYLRVEFFFDDVSQGVEELSKNTTGWEHYTKSIPNGTNNVRFKTMAYQNGSSDYGAIDNITLSSNVVLAVEKQEIENFSVYPNPISHGEFRISTLNNSEKIVQIFDILGKQVYSNKIFSNEKIIINNINTGIYLLRVEEDNKIATRKLIIK